jgi:hypothetical protein
LLGVGVAQASTATLSGTVTDATTHDPGMLAGLKSLITALGLGVDPAKAPSLTANVNAAQTASS